MCPVARIPSPPNLELPTKTWEEGLCRVPGKYRQASQTWRGKVDSTLISPISRPSFAPILIRHRSGLLCPSLDSHYLLSDQLKLSVFARALAQHLLLPNASRSFALRMLKLRARSLVGRIFFISPGRTTRLFCSCACAIPQIPAWLASGPSEGSLCKLPLLRNYPRCRTLAWPDCDRHKKATLQPLARARLGHSPAL